MWFGGYEAILQLPARSPDGMAGSLRGAALVEPSPPPPPWPAPPEPSPPLHAAPASERVAFTSLLSGERVQLLGGEPQGPSLVLHAAVSIMSAVVMLILACSLRVQVRLDSRPRRRDVPVAEARPVMLAYGILPTSESPAVVEMDGDSAAIPMAVGQRVGVSVAPAVDAGQPEDAADELDGDTTESPTR